MNLVDIGGELFNTGKIIKISDVYEKMDAHYERPFEFKITFDGKIVEAFSFSYLEQAKDKIQEIVTAMDRNVVVVMKQMDYKPIKSQPRG